MANPIAAMCIADGKVSFEDCDMLTWSLGCTGCLLPSGVPANWQQRFDMTSLTFMLNWVPLPVIHTCSGNMSWCSPARDFVTNPSDQFVGLVIEATACMVRGGRGTLQDRVSRDHLARDQILANAEVLQ
jgi:hypothetical protein